jgi:hypothetical protein
VQNPTITPIVNDIHFFDSSNGLAVANNGLVLGTSNGGATWSVISTIVDEDLEVLVMLNSTTGWATGSSIYRTDDGGQSWTLEWFPTPIGGEIISMALNPAGNALLACGSSNTILRYMLPVGINEEIILSKSHVSQNFPNPFSGLSSVFVSLDKPAILELVVTNMVGQTVYLLPAKNYSAGRQEMQIDATGFPSGVYFYTVNSIDNSVTRKMVIR